MKLVHGEDQQKSRNHFLTQKDISKSRGLNLINIDGISITYPEFVTIVTSNSLFPEANIYFVENVFSRRPSKDREKIINHIFDNPGLDIWIWEPKDVSDQTKKIPPGSIIRFDIPKYVYSYLDKPTLTLLDKALNYTAPEQIMSLLVRHIHNLILCKSGSSDLPAWQADKLKPLAGRLTMAQILDLYRQLLQIDSRQKKSDSAFNLAASLSIWTANLQNTVNPL